VPIYQPLLPSLQFDSIDGTIVSLVYQGAQPGSPSYFRYWATNHMISGFSYDGMWNTKQLSGGEIDEDATIARDLTLT